MKILINKVNPEIRITAPDIEEDKTCYYIAELAIGKCNWTLVEEEFPKVISDEKMKQMGEEICKAVVNNINEQFSKIEDALQQRMLDISQEPVTRMVGEQGVLEIEKVNCPFDKGNCRYCAVQFCGAREENQIETRCPVVIVDCSSEKQPEVDLEKDIEMEWESFNKHVAEYGEKSEDVVWLNWPSFVDVAKYFYELGKLSNK